MWGYRPSTLQPPPSTTPPHPSQATWHVPSDGMPNYQTAGTPRRQLGGGASVVLGCVVAWFKTCADPGPHPSSQRAFLSDVHPTFCLMAGLLHDTPFIEPRTPGPPLLSHPVAKSGIVRGRRSPLLCRQHQVWCRMRKPRSAPCTSATSGLFASTIVQTTSLTWPDIHCLNMFHRKASAESSAVPRSLAS